MTPTAFVGTLAAAILGAAGVAAAAASYHAGDALLAPLSLIALTHAPTLLILSLAAPATRSFAIALLFIGVGAFVFCADLALKQYVGQGFFTYVSPIAGILMIVGWLVAALGAILVARRTAPVMAH